MEGLADKIEDEINETKKNIEKLSDKTDNYVSELKELIEEK